MKLPSIGKPDVDTSIPPKIIKHYSKVLMYHAELESIIHMKSLITNCRNDSQ